MSHTKIYSYYDPHKGLIDSLTPAGGSLGGKGFRVLGGGSSFAGEVLFQNGLSGSLTQLTDGTSYLVAGDNVTITTGSNGAVTVASTGGAGFGTGVGWFSPSLNVISTSGSVFFGVDSGTTNPDITFGDNGAANFNHMQNAAGDFKVSSDTKTHAIFVNAGSEKVFILSGSGITGADGTDVNFFVSGTIGAKDSTVKGTSVFGGDIMVSGTLVANGLADGAYPAIKIDKDYIGTTDVGSLLSLGTDAAGLVVDYDVTGIVASGQTAYHDAIAVHYNQDAPTHVGTVNATGADIRMTGGTSGAQTMKGVAITLAGADNHTGIDITAPNDSTHFIARSPDALLDFCKISVGESGATTISTSDQHAAAADLTLDADGKIVIEAMAGDEVVFNEGGADVDFRVETNSDTEAIFLNSGAKILHINKGKQAFETKIWNNSDTALEVNSSGVVINEEKHAQNDLRVETVNKTHALFVDSSTDQVIFHSSSAVPTDVSFYVSGSTGASTGVSLFGGDLFVSGNMNVGTVASDSGGTALYMKDDKVIFNSSDVRLKTNLRDIEDPLDKVTALRGYRYNAIGDVGGPDYLGFLGQEVEKVVPELAYTSPSGYMGVRYAETTALLVEAIKELKGEVTRLGGELETTKTQLAEACNKIVELDTEVDQVFENLTAYVDQKDAKNEE